MSQIGVTENWFADRQSLSLMIGGALLAVLLAVNFLCSETPDRARIVRIHGQASIQRSGEAITPSVGMLLNARDKVTTSGGAFIEVSYDDRHKGIMRIGADSRVVFESARIERNTTIFMDQGAIMVKLDNLEKGSMFKIRTPVAIAGVRGTAFGVQLKGKEVIITDYESRIFVKGLTREFMEMKDELLLNDGWKVAVAQFEKPSRVEPMTARERVTWDVWLNSINALPKASSLTSASLVSLTDMRSVSWHDLGAWMSAVRTRISLSPSILSLMLFAVLALGTGKVVERVWV